MSITLIIIVVTALLSWATFGNDQTFERFCFTPYEVWQKKEWYRVLTGGFLHANMQHLFFNMLSLFFFGPYVEVFFREIFGSMGNGLYVLFYITAIAIANIPDLILQKDNYSYRAVGASGAVSAVIFASIIFSPTSTIYFMFFPMPAFVFAILYLVYSAYMAKRGMDNIGHLAHFSGAIFGFAFPLILRPALFIEFIQQIIGK